MIKTQDVDVVRRRKTLKARPSIPNIQKQVFFIDKSQNPNIGHFQMTTSRDFKDFLKISHKLTSYEVKYAPNNLRNLKNGFCI